jgi:hypothetical protein
MARITYLARMNRLLLSAAIALTLSACTAEPESRRNVSDSRARGVATQPVQPRSGDFSMPAPASLGRTDLDAPIVAPRAAAPSVESRPGLSLRLDASSPESLVASLKRAESTLGPRDLERLRAALTVIQLMMSRKVAALAVADPTQANLTDDQLLRLGFGEVDGKTIKEVIDYSIRMAPIVVPDGLGGPTMPPTAGY